MLKYDYFSPSDIFNLELVNLDSKTETFTFGCYLYYIHSYPEDCIKVTSSGRIVGYLIGKHSTVNGILRGHVTALSIAPGYRNFGIGKTLMNMLEQNGIAKNAYYIDLFVRCSNEPAIQFYKKNNYVIHREIIDYYCNPVENGYDMRKSLPMDKYKTYEVCLDKPIKFADLEEENK